MRLARVISTRKERQFLKHGLAAGSCSPFELGSAKRSTFSQVQAQNDSSVNTLVLRLLLPSPQKDYLENTMAVDSKRCDNGVPLFFDPRYSRLYVPKPYIIASGWEAANLACISHNHGTRAIAIK